MGDSSDNDVPDREVCEERINIFVTTTQSNSAVAQQFLQESNWNLEPAVSAFFDALARESTEEQYHGSHSPDKTVVEQLFGEGKTITNQPPPRLQLLSWNIDGLDERSLKRRMAVVVKLVQQLEPDVIFLQEVIDEVAEYFFRKLPEYKMVRGIEGRRYFTVTLLRVFTVKYDDHETIPFPGSSMGRDLLVCRAHIGERKFALLNTHLESGRDFSEERIQQLRRAFQVGVKFPLEVTVIFGGDLNLRDREVQDVPAGFLDAWEECGARASMRWTWDTQRNTNLGISGWNGKGGPRCRFDRVYVRPEVRRVELRDFALVGAQKAPNTQMFPSDHWGVFVFFDLLH